MIDCVVVGGGLAGLACAHSLARSGRSVTVLESGAEPGGRARTAWHEGRPVDLGFQSLFKAYPETGRFVKEIGIRRRDLRAFERGAVFHDGQAWSRFGAGPRAFARFAPFGAGDRGRLVRLLAEVASKPPEVLLDLDGPEATALEMLQAKGFSQGAIEGFFRPLFGVITLDRTLSADPGYFRFLLSMLGRGAAVLPSDGMGMISEWAAAAVERLGGVVCPRVVVRELVADERGPGRRLLGVRTAGDEVVEARQVVLAADAGAARVLLEPFDPESAARIPQASAGAVSLAYLLDRPLYRGRTIILNSAQATPEPRIDLVCQTTNVTRPGVPQGPHVLLATSVMTGDEVTAAGLDDAMARLVGQWSPRFPWREGARLVETVVHPFAQFRPLAGVRRTLPGPRTAADNLLLAGDHTMHPSIEGAVASGRRAASIVDALLA